MKDMKGLLEITDPLYFQIGKWKGDQRNDTY